MIYVNIYCISYIKVDYEVENNEEQKEINKQVSNYCRAIIMYNTMYVMCVYVWKTGVCKDNRN